MEPGLALGIAAIVGIIGIVLGYAVGSANRGNKDTTTPELKHEHPIPRGVPHDSVEVLSVWRVERTGKLLALLEGKPLSPSHLEPAHKEKIHHLLGGLHAIIGEPIPTPAPVIAPAPTSVEPRPVASPTMHHPPEAELAQDILPPAETQPEPHPEEHPVEGQASKVYFADTLPEPVTLRTALASNPFKINVPKTTKPATIPKSIVEQIDEILQAKIAGSPYADKGVKLEEKSDGMLVYIGDFRYEGIDAVPDATVRALIKESAREWNERASKRK